MIGYMPENGFDFLAPPRAPRPRPTRPHMCFIPLEFQPPHRVEGHRDHGRIVGPMLESRPAARDKVFERPGSILAAPRPENEIVSPRQRVDAVDLDKPQIVQHAVQVFAPAGAAARPQQSMPIKKKTPGVLIVHKEDGQRVMLSTL